MNRSIATVSPSYLLAKHSAGEATVVDVRSAAEFRTGHVKGALNVPMDELDQLAYLLDNVGSGKEAHHSLVLTCLTGIRSQQAAEQLEAQGYRYLATLQGGTRAWDQAGLPIQRCGIEMSLERQVQIAIGSLLIAFVSFGFTVHDGFFALAALVGSGLIVAGLTRWCGMAQVMAHMPWNQRPCADSTTS